jgi:DNA end-binding protein Ku
MAARAIWKGVIQFGGAQLPVKLFSAVQDTSIHFHLLHDQDMVRLKQRMVNPDTGKTVAYGDAKRGFEVEPGVFVVLENELLETLEPQESRDIEITRFVPSSAIDAQWYDRPYYLGPDEDEDADYFALVEALKKQKREGVAKWAMRKKSYVGALRVEGDYLMLMTLRYAGQVISPSELEPPAGRKLDKKELQLAEKLISTLEDKFDPSDYHDEYKQRVMELIETKSRGGKVEVKKRYKPKRKAKTLAEMLEASLQQAS